MKTIRMPSGDTVPALGQGTWMMGEEPSKRQAEIASLQAGLDAGLRLIDTAEMYGEGDTERLVGEAIAGRRQEVFLVSKVYPHNASRKAMPLACGNSLKRLRTDVIDLYLLHWSGPVPLAETIDAFERLRKAGQIRHWGVSNLDIGDMEELSALPGGAACQTNQVLFNLKRRGIEWDLLPWMRERAMPAMAYSPIEQGRVLAHPGLVALAAKLDMTPAQLALGWVLAQEGVIAIPKTGSAARLRENIGAVEKPLPVEALAELDKLFPPPKRKVSLEML